MRMLGLAAIVAALFLAAGADAAERNCSGRECTLVGTNFRIFYTLPKSGGPNAQHRYAKVVLGALETAWTELFGRLGFKQPAWTEKQYVDTYIRQPRKDLGVLGLAHSGLVGNPYIVVGTEMQMMLAAVSVGDTMSGDSDAGKDHVARSTAGHEFFHLVQRGYVDTWVDRYRWNDVKWAFEATAAWAESQIYRPKKKWKDAYGFVSRTDDWTGDDGDPLIGTVEEEEYGASFFFQYLTERKPGSVKVVRDMLANLGAQGVTEVSALAALAKALGDRGGYGANTRERIAEFSVAALVASPAFHPTFSFEDLRGTFWLDRSDMFDNLGDDTVTLSGATHREFRGGKISWDRKWTTDLAFGYVEIKPPKKTSSVPTDLEVAVRRVEGKHWAFHLVEIPFEHGKPAGAWTVRRFELADDGTARLGVENFSAKRRVILVAANLAPNPKGTVDQSTLKEWDFAAALVSAPVVESFAVYTPGLEKAWQVSRKPGRERGTWTTTNPVAAGLTHVPKGRAVIIVRTSRPMAGNLQASIGDTRVTLKPVGKGKDLGRIFKGQLDLDEVFSLLLTGDKEKVMLPVEVEGKDPLGVSFDQDPKTAPRLFTFEDDAEFRDWEGDGASAPGGVDRLGGFKIALHKLETPPYLRSVLVIQKAAPTSPSLANLSSFSGRRHVVYEASWKPVKATSTVRRLDVKTSAAYDPRRPAAIELRFSGPLDERTLKLTLEGVDIKVTRNESRESETVKDAILGTDKSITEVLRAAGAVYTGDIPASPALLAILKKKGELQLAVSGRTYRGTGIDVDPRSRAYFDWVKRAWDGYDGAEGGADRWHKLSAGGTSYVLVFDASRSMAEGGRLADAKSGVRDLLADIKPRDEVALIVFYDCKDVRTVLPFTHDREAVWAKVRRIKPTRGTPLGDAVALARAYMAKHAGYDRRTVMVFSDGNTTCGKRAIDAVKPAAPAAKPKAKPKDKEPPARTVEWRRYKVTSKQGRFRPQADVIEVRYRERGGRKPHATITVTRYPVSTASTGGRTWWSIGWGSGAREDARDASGRDQVAALKRRAEALAAGGMERGGLSAALDGVFRRGRALHAESGQ